MGRHGAGGAISLVAVCFASRSGPLFASSVVVRSSSATTGRLILSLVMLISAVTVAKGQDVGDVPIGEIGDSQAAGWPQCPLWVESPLASKWTPTVLAPYPSTSSRCAARTGPQPHRLSELVAWLAWGDELAKGVHGAAAA